MLLKITPLVKDDAPLLGGKAQDVDPVLGGADGLVVDLVELEEDVDAVDVARRAHLLQRKPLPVGAEDDVASLHLVEEDVLEDVEEAPELKLAHDLGRKPVIQQRDVLFPPNRGVDAVLDVVDPALEGLDVGAFELEDAGRPIYLQLNNSLLLQYRVLHVHLLEVQDALGRLIFDAVVIFVFVVPQNPVR